MKFQFIINMVWILMTFSIFTSYYWGTDSIFLVILFFVWYFFISLTNYVFILKFIKDFKTDKNIKKVGIYSSISGFLIYLIVTIILSSQFCNINCISYDNIDGKMVCKEFEKVEVELEVPNNFDNCNITEPNRCSVTSKKGKNIVTIDLSKCDSNKTILYGNNIKCYYTISLIDSKHGNNIKYSNKVYLRYENIEDIVKQKGKKCK